MTFICIYAHMNVCVSTHTHIDTYIWTYVDTQTHTLSHIHTKMKRVCYALVELPADSFLFSTGWWNLSLSSSLPMFLDFFFFNRTNTLKPLPSITAAPWMTQGAVSTVSSFCCSGVAHWVLSLNVPGVSEELNAEHCTNCRCCSLSQERPTLLPAM